MSVTNENNVAGYIGNVENAFFNGSINSTTNPGVTGNYLIDTFENNINPNLGDINVSNPDGTTGSWSFNILSLLTPQVPAASLNLQINDVYNGSYGTAGANIALNQPTTVGESSSILIGSIYTELNSMIYGAYSQYGLSINGSLQNAFLGQQQLSVNLGSLNLSASQIASWYQNNPYNPATWDTSAFWQSTSGSPSNAEMLALYNVLMVAGNLNPTQGYGLLPTTPPVSQIPSTFNGFLSTLKQSKTQLVSGTAPGVDLVPSVNLSVQPANFTSVNNADTGSNLLDILFAQYIQNYQSLIPGLLQKAAASGATLITNIESPEALATGWYEYLQEGLPSNFITTSIPINYTDSSNSFSISSGQSASLAGANNTILTSNAGLPSLSSFVSTFVGDMQTDFDNQIQYTTDFAGITTTLPTSTSTTQPTAAEQDLFNSNFQTFMNYMLAQGGQTTVSDYSSFMNQWNSFIGPIAILNSTSNEDNSQNLLTYLKIYDEFYPSGTTQNTQFIQHLTSFVNGFLGPTGSGTFSPSLMIDQWFSNLVNNVYSSHVVIPSVSLDALGSYENVRILNTLYKGLASMVQTIQVLTVAQATRLSFYSDQQELYTELLKKIPVVIENPIYQQTIQGQEEGSQAANLSQIVSTSPIDSSSNNDSQARSDFNTLSSQFTTNVQSFRSESSAQGNQFQAAFSQSNQSVNEDISIATKILQIVNAIANSIFQQQQANFDGQNTV